MRATVKVVLLSIVLLLGVGGPIASADPIPIIEYYTSEAALLAANPDMVILALDEFNGGSLDPGIAITPGGALGPGPSYYYYETTGPLTFSLMTGGEAHVFGIGFFPMGFSPPTGWTGPPVSILLANGSWFEIEPLGGAPTGLYSYLWGFSSSEPFTAVHLALGDSESFWTDFVAFGGTPIPEPATLLLLGAGLAASARRLARSGRR